jgi:hypothetical protein
LVDTRATSASIKRWSREIAALMIDSRNPHAGAAAGQHSNHQLGDRRFIASRLRPTLSRGRLGWLAGNALAGLARSSRSFTTNRISFCRYYQGRTINR